MQPIIITSSTPGPEVEGAIVTHEVRVPGGGRLRKGRPIGCEDLELIPRLDRPVHAVRLEPGDIHEDDAARWLARIVGGPHLQARDPVQSRVNIVATARGLLRVDAEAVGKLNALAPIGVFTMLDRVPVVPGKIVAGTKIATVAVEQAILEEAEAFARDRPGPVLEVKPFLPHRAGVVVTEDLAGPLRDRFERSVRQKMTWYGSEIVRFAYIQAESAIVAETARALLDEGADLILVAGGNMMDPLDPTLVAMPAIAAELTRLGAPAHPGSMFWMGEIPALGIPVVNLASCSMYSRSTVADLVLPWVMAGERVTAADIAALGYGGLLDRAMGWRFPDYETQAVDEPDEE